MCTNEEKKSHRCYLRHDKSKKVFGTFLHTASWMFKNSVIARRHSTVIEGNAIKKRMGCFTHYFAKIHLAHYINTIWQAWNELHSR